MVLIVAGEIGYGFEVLRSGLVEYVGVFGTVVEDLFLLLVVDFLVFGVAVLFVPVSIGVSIFSILVLGSASQTIPSLSPSSR